MKSLPEVSVGSEEPLYNIGVVSRMTGVTMATLRAWERRYNFPESERTAGGHRLYSEKDVMQLQWVKGRIEEGMQTAQAIHALRHQVQTGNLALVDRAPTMKVDSVEQVPARHLHSYSDQLQNALIVKNLLRWRESWLRMDIFLSIKMRMRKLKHTNVKSVLIKILA